MYVRRKRVLNGMARGVSVCHCQVVWSVCICKAWFWVFSSTSYTMAGVAFLYYSLYYHLINTTNMQ